MTSGSTQLVVAPEVSGLGIVATYLVVEDLNNRETDPEFERYKADLCERLREEYTETFVKDDPTVEGFRELRRRIGRSVRKYPCSIESLIGCLSRTGGIPSISLAVDIYNCVSLETRLTLGAHDLDHVVGDITPRLATGDERFVPLGRSQPEKVGAGDYCYIDDSDEVLCWLDCKQGDKTKLTAETTRCLFIVQGNPNTPVADIERAKTRLAELIGKYCRTAPDAGLGTGRAGLGLTPLT